MTPSVRFEHRSDWIPESPPTGPAQRVVVKIRTGPGSLRTAFAEASALGGVRHRHIVPLLGIESAGPDLGLVLPELSTITARQWLARVGGVSAGEAVTLLVPLLRALHHLERRGFAPQLDLAAAVRLDNVLFDASGAPVVVGLRAAPSYGSAPRGDSAAEGRRPSIAAARQIIDEALGAVGDGDEQRLLDVRAAMRDDAGLDDLIEAVYSLAEACPLDGVHDADIAAMVESPPIGSRNRAVAPAATMLADAEPSGAPQLLDHLVPGYETIREVVLRSAALRRIVDVGTAFANALRQIRPAFWSLGALVVGSVAVAVFVLPAPEAASGEGSSMRLSERSATRPPREQATPDPPRGDSARLEGDDTDAAVTLLLDTRRRCLTNRDRTCLEQVDQAGSPALRNDLAALDDPLLFEGLALDLEVGAAVDRVGSMVMYPATVGEQREPASVLIARTEAGWRLRAIA